MNGEGMSAVRIVKMAIQYLEEIRDGKIPDLEDIDVAISGLAKLEVAVHQNCPVVSRITGKKMEVK